MGTSTDRWAEYRAGTLTPPAVVQHDVDDRGVHSYYVWTGMKVIGPLCRTHDNEASVLAEDFVTSANNPVYRITCEDGYVIEVYA